MGRRTLCSLQEMAPWRLGEPCDGLRRTLLLQLTVYLPAELLVVHSVLWHVTLLCLSFSEVMVAAEGGGVLLPPVFLCLVLERKNSLHCACLLLCLCLQCGGGGY